MSAASRRVVFCLLVGLAMLVVAGRRLSDSSRRMSAEAYPALWERADHPDSPSPPSAGEAAASNCLVIISLDRGNPYTLTSVEEGVPFDIDADGDLDRVSWTEAGSDVAFLGIDRDGDGRISNGSELIGDRTLPGVRNGPNALTALASDAIGGERRARVDSENPLFFKLLLWTDVNHNGVSEPAELRSIAQAVSGIGLGYERHHRRDRHGHESRYRGFVHLRTAPGLNSVTSAADSISRRRSFYDVCLVTAAGQQSGGSRQYGQ